MKLVHRGRRALLLLSWALILLGSGCGSIIKDKQKVTLPEAYQKARTATIDEVTSLVNSKFAGLSSLVVSRFEVEFQGGSAELGFIEKYPKAKGYLVAQRPDSVYVNILHPLTSSTVVAMAARGEDFRIWSPRDNKFLVGKTSLKTDENKPLFNVRPQHILQAVLIDAINRDNPHTICFMEEALDPNFKYYVISVVGMQAQAAPCLVRKIWVERSKMVVVRQQYYECGALQSDIRYGPPVLDGTVTIPGQIHVERVMEHYVIRLKLESDGLELNRSIKEDRFDIPQPPGAEVIEVNEKGT